MTKKTGTKWSTVDCGRCGKPHSGYSGKLDAKGQEYVVCGATNKRMDVSQSTEHMLSRVYATNWTSDNTVAIQESKMKITRYAVQVNCKRDGEIVVGYESIGRGIVSSPQDAHLYTRRDLAQAKVKQYMNRSQWYAGADIIEVEVIWSAE